jgi:glutaminase
MNEATPHNSDANAGDAYISTGSLPSGAEVRALIETAHQRFAREAGGKIADYIPALAEADPAHFGICVASTRGEAFAAGDSDHAFSIQSVSKPFVFALVCEAIGPDEVERLLGVDATGQPFNSVMAIELRADHTTNPMVNSGAIATTSLVAGASAAERWTHVSDGLSRFAGRRLELDESVYASETATNERNEGIAHLMCDTAASTATPTKPRIFTPGSARCSSPRATSRQWARPLPAAASTRPPASVWSRPAPAGACSP